MDILLIIVIGGIVGWLAAGAAGRSIGILASIAIGVIGSIIGGVLFTLLTGGNQSYLVFSMPGIIWSFLGSVILVALLNAVQRHSYRH